jgi:hypothetical protein
VHDVSEFVEEGLDLVVIEQRGLGLRRLGKVRDHQAHSKLKMQLLTKHIISDVLKCLWIIIICVLNFELFFTRFDGNWYQNSRALGVF